MPTTGDYQLLSAYLIAGAILFVLGAMGFACRRNLLVQFLSVGLMVQGAMLSLIAFSAFHGTWSGQVFALVMLAVVSVHAAIVLPMIHAAARRQATGSRTAVASTDPQSPPNLDAPVRLQSEVAND